MENYDKEAWQVLKEVALSSIEEKRRSRRWGIFFKFLIFIYLFWLLSLIMYVVFPGAKSDSSSLRVSANKGEEHTAVVLVHGPIMSDQDAAAGRIITSLNDAFEAENSKAIVLAINSPGGSAVHAGYVYDEIVRLRQLHPEKKVYAVISDLGASAAYYIAAAADEIYADKASLVGSIGVISASFGFTGAMEKIGVERRVFTSGDNKAFLDPYQPLKSEEKAFWDNTLGVVHQQFIEQVKKGRGDRLKDDPKLFSGFIWTGEQALENGLVDGLGGVRYVAREIVGAEELVDYSIQRSPFEQMVREFGLSVAAGVAQQIQLQSMMPKVQ